MKSSSVAITTIQLTGNYQLMMPTLPREVTESAYLYITKPYICEQVELHENDVDASYGTLILKHNGLVLGDNEVIVSKQPESENKYLFKVCLEDYLLNSSNSKKAIQFIGGWLFLIFLSTTLY